MRKGFHGLGATTKRPRQTGIENETGTIQTHPSFWFLGYTYPIPVELYMEVYERTETNTAPSKEYCPNMFII